VDLKPAERVRLLWVFRNFSILPQHVLPTRQRAWITEIYGNDRLRRYDSMLDREIASVIGTLVTAEPSLRTAHDERRRAARLPLHFVVRYAVPCDKHTGPKREPAFEMTDGAGCDVSETGIAFNGPKAFPVGTEVTVHFRLSSTRQETWSRTRAVVRNVEPLQPSGFRIGAEFCIIHPRDRAELRQLTSNVKSADAVPATAESPSVVSS
jgi:hypothetical protein